MGTQMKRKNIKIASEVFPDFALREITIADMENLRRWKNDNRRSFFYQEEISSEQQKKWFEAYCTRPDDYMFIVEENVGTGSESHLHAIGCMGFRMEDERTIDLYNIIRGERSMTHATMQNAMQMMLRYIANTFPALQIQCDVLKNNPAVEWYQKCGLAIWEEREYYIMGIRKEDIPEIPITVVDEERSKL